MMQEAGRFDKAGMTSPLIHAPGSGVRPVPSHSELFQTVQMPG
jgi:hypothetical protein